VEVFGCPAGARVARDDVQKWLDRRKPGQSNITSKRQEDDEAIIEAGIENGKTTGGTIRIIVKNKDTRSKDYEKFGTTPRPGHADYPASVRYGKVEGGSGVFSGRMTAAFVMAGAVAKKILEEKGISTLAFSSQIGKVQCGTGIEAKATEKGIYSNVTRCPDGKTAKLMEKEIEKARDEGDSVGGVIECRVTGIGAGEGEPMFASVESRISQAMFAIPAVKGIEFGSGFAGSALKGSQNNDEYIVKNGKVSAKTNNSGGILGGLTSGMPIVFRVAIKPTSSIFKKQHTVNISTMKSEELKIEGRHDPCIAIRAVPVVECMAAVCMADIILSKR
ncbi:MAG TPA: chorismate synthase, partial [Candidatus Micrarchaeota archaeon]|nr:chorismate synthase [Candidatus Micrarchaeota archaeon]